MYGFDIVLDQKLEMKVLEINFSPQVSNQGASQWKREMNRAIVEEVSRAMLHGSTVIGLGHSYRQL